MLKIFSSTATTFNTLGIGVLRDYVSDPIITEELNGAYTLEFEYAKNGYLSEYLIESNIVVAKGQAFRIWNIDKSSVDRIKILAKHIFFDLAFIFNTSSLIEESSKYDVSFLHSSINLLILLNENPPFPHFIDVILLFSIVIHGAP